MKTRANEINKKKEKARAKFFLRSLTIRIMARIFVQSFVKKMLNSSQEIEIYSQNSSQVFPKRPAAKGDTDIYRAPW